MKLKNYTTSINEYKTIMEIEQMLAEFGATNIFKQYEDSKIQAIAFQLYVKEKVINFKLPMDSDKVFTVMKKSNIPNSKKSKEQAIMTGWRIIKDWLHSQLSLIKINIAEPEQVFLPYMWDMKTGETMYDKLVKSDFKMIELHENKGNGK